jgi:hypothetical protein
MQISHNWTSYQDMVTGFLEKYEGGIENTRQEMVLCVTKVPFFRSRTVPCCVKVFWKVCLCRVHCSLRYEMAIAMLKMAHNSLIFN